MNPHLINMLGYFGLAAILFTISIVSRWTENEKW